MGRARDGNGRNVRVALLGFLSIGLCSSLGALEGCHPAETPRPASSSPPPVQPSASVPRPLASGGAATDHKFAPCAKTLPVPPAPPLSASQLVDQGSLKAWVDYLAQPKFKGRPSGHEEARQVALALSTALKQRGFGPPSSAKEHSGFCQAFPLRGDFGQNVAGELPQPSSAPVIILGAHYDHLGMAGGELHPGADDNASGVAVALEVARLAHLHRGSLKVRPVIAFFGAEEDGTIGSRFMAKRLPSEWAKAALMINLDMVGRPLLQGSLVRKVLGNPESGMGFVLGSHKQQRVFKAAERAADSIGAELFGIPLPILKAAGFASDNIPFDELMPTLMLSSSIHSDYHRPSDIPERIDPKQLVRTTKLVWALFRAPQDPPSEATASGTH